MNLNKVFIIGRLTADPQLRTTPTGTEVATLGVATNRTWIDKSGQKKEEAEFHNVVVWGKQASIVKQFLVKGSMIFIEGRLQTRSWEGKDGQPRKTTEIVADRIQLGPRPSGGGAPRSETRGDSPAKEEMPVIDIDREEIKKEDLPF